MKLALVGNVTTGKTEELWRSMRPALDGTEDVEIDCRDADNLGLAAMQLLVSLRRYLAERGHALRIVHAGEQIASSLALAGFSAALPLETP